MFLIFFFFNDTATTEIYTLSLHDALPISLGTVSGNVLAPLALRPPPFDPVADLTPIALVATVPLVMADRKSTRLNSSHANISYAVFCLKKKKIIKYKSHNIYYDTAVY